MVRHSGLVVSASAALLVALLGAACSQRPEGATREVRLPPLGETVSKATSSTYAGTAACAPCHAAQTAEWKQSRHAETLRAYQDSLHRHLFESAGIVRDTDRQVTYLPRIGADGKPVIQIARKGQPVEYLKVALALGSGRVATTFMPWEVDGSSVNTRITNYSGHGWDWSPQQRPSDEITSVHGAPVPAERAHECFKCHATRMVTSGERLILDQSELGIGCESCHGPGAAHIASVKVGDLRSRGTALASAAAVITRCEPCHAAPTEPISPDTDPEIPRFKTTALKLSACRLPDKQPLRCTTCHDPHARLNEDRSSYDETCSGCHQAQNSGVCRLGETSRCTNCHMPSSPVPSSPYVRFVNHWIRVYPTVNLDAAPGKSAGQPHP